MEKQPRSNRTVPAAEVASVDSDTSMSPGAETNPIALSIVTVNYNSAPLLSATLGALRWVAEHRSIELIVVDGGSTDGSKSVCDEHRDVISRFVCERDRGIYDAMNKGIALCRGAWIWFVNAGDIPAIGPLELLQLLANATHAGANCIYSDLRVGDVTLRQELKLRFLALRTVNHQNIIYARELLAEGYDIGYRFCADYSHLLNVYHRLSPMKSDRPLCLYDYTGISSAPSRSRRIAIWKERLRAQVHSPLNMAIKSAFMAVSLLAIAGKWIHPGIGRTRIRQAS